MDLEDQLRQLFPDHTTEDMPEKQEDSPGLWLQDKPLLCKYEKRKGKPITLIEGYTGAESDFKKLTKELKTAFSTGGSYKNDVILIQGDFRDKIMELLKAYGFQVKRVGG